MAFFSAGSRFLGYKILLFFTFAGDNALYSALSNFNVILQCNCNLKL